MEILRKLWKKNKWFILIPLLVVAAIIYIASGCFGNDIQAEAASGNDQAETQLSAQTDDIAEEEIEKIFVDVEGAVLSPGVVILDSGARIFEALEAAGGVLEGSETKYINLAAICSDGEKLYVPTEVEVNEQNTGKEMEGLFETSMDLTGNPDSSLTSSPGKVNINTADSAELQTLTGIGPSMAERIIDYRNQNGKFSTVDQLTSVSGIGEKTLSKIYDKICV